MNQEFAKNVTKVCNQLNNESIKMKKYDEIYQNEVIPKMTSQFKFANRLEIPKITKVVLSIGTGQSQINPKFSEAAEKTLMLISGQKPKYCLSKKAISGFKLRKGIKIGLQVTLRSKKMKDFIERLIHIILPRIRDFRGLSSQAFDGHGNYTLGIKEQNIFTEINFDEIQFTHGLAITIVTDAKSDIQAKELLNILGFPFKK